MAAEPPSAALAFHAHISRAFDIYSGRAVGEWAVADALVIEAARIAVEDQWTALALWNAFDHAVPGANPERLIPALARIKAEKALEDGSIGPSANFERVLSIFEDAERIDMLTVRETAFAPEYLPTH